MMKRILSLLMALCMIGTLVPGTVFAAEQELPARMEQIEIPVQVNPLYADVVEPEEFHRQGGEYVPMAEAVYLPEAQAAVEVRKHLKNRTESFTVYLSVPEITFEQAEIERIVVSLFEAALAHTGDPLEGDYLRWQYGRWGVPENGITYGVDGSKMTMAINYMVEYYTTAEQEAELTGRVNQLLAELDLEDVCDYETLREIYSYIISHVVYDYDNLNNYNHKLKYTAYAALINGTAVCQGYSVLLYRLALELGLDARLVPGDSNNDGSTDHAWSILELNGQYYNADATWDSEIGQIYYFLRGSDNFPDHTPDYSYLEAGFAENYPMSAADFQHSVRSETTAPTCTEGGYTTCICNCGDSYRTDRTEAVGHSWDSGSVTKEPTETETGIRTYTCTVCGATREEELPKLDHEHSYQSSVTAPTCTEEGYTTYTCACGDSYVGDKVPALGHTEVIDPAVEATCTESGLTEGKHCSVCEQVLITRETVPAKGHSWDSGSVTKEPTETETGIRTYTCTVCGATREEELPKLDHEHSYQSSVTAPTCTEEGYTTYTCACGDSYVGDKVPALGHTEVIDPAVEATCTESGLTEGKHCSVCEQVLIARETVPAKGHSWDSGSVTKEPTETETGIRTYTCTACGATREEELPKLDHEHSYQSSVTAPTCTEEGYTTYTCACGDSYVGDKVPALGHTEVIDPAVEATCTESGLTEGKHCSVCEQVLIARETVPAKGHTYENGICAVCGAEDPTNPSEPEETDPTDPSEPEETDPTDPSEPEETDPTNPSEPEEHTHQFSEWITVKEPTGREEGMEERRCVCGEIESRAVPKLTNPFSDVKKTDYFYDSVLWAAHRGITSGITATRFAPTQPCTRAQVVTFLWRAAGEPEPVSGKNPFTDVNPAAYYYKAVLWAVEEGITSGMSATTFGPNRACTRGQVVTFLWRTAGEPEAVHQENSFTDVNPGAFYYKAVLWAVENGITTGMGSGSFAPGSSCTRGQIVTFLYRAFTKQ